MKLFIMSTKSIAPNKLLAAFEEGCGKYSKPLLTKNHDVVIPPPILLPGETLILQQDKVTCVNTLSQAATGAIHLTNYRIIFTGNYMQNKKYAHEMNADYLAALGYRYQERRNLFSKVSPNFRKLVEKSRSLKNYRKIKRTKPDGLYIRKSASTDHIFNDHDFAHINPIFDPESVKKERTPSISSEKEVMITLPILSLYDIKKFPKQYIESEKLLMLKPGIEILTTNYLSVKLCLGDEGSYDADELITRLLRHSKVKIFTHIDVTTGATVYQKNFLGNPSSIFAYMYAFGVVLPKHCDILQKKDCPNIYQLESEIQRLDATSSSEWKVTTQLINDVYPEEVIVPRASMGSGKLKAWAEFHRSCCFPVVVWRDKSKTLLRSAQTVTPRGNADTRCIIDEEIISSICSASNSQDNGRSMIIFTDSGPCNSPTNGLTMKEGEAYFYPYCEIVHLDNLPDLSSTHQSALKLQYALSKNDDSRYLSSIEESGWLNQVQILLDYTMCMVAALTNENLSVLISIGSGTERVAQLCSLVQLLVDPYYRTLNGFQVLIQKEWMSIKYPFQKRNLIDLSSEEDLSPLFLQFLDCVWQLSQQYPTTFQFSEQLLELLAVHAYSGRFKTFITEADEKKPSISVWTYIKVLSKNNDDVLNFNYDKHQNIGVLQPNVSFVHLSVWSWFTQYKKEDNIFVASMFAMMEMEKLQREYKDLLQQHNHLLQMLSHVDAYSNNPAINSLSLSPSSVVSDSSSDAMSVVSSDDSMRQPPVRKWLSADDLLNYDNSYDASATVSRTDFFRNRETNAIDVLKRLRSSSFSDVSSRNTNSFNLRDHLLKRGIDCNIVKDVRVSNMTCSGYLTKQGGKIKTWLTRWFVADLQKRFVAYFEGPLSKEPIRVFNFLTIRSVNAKTYRKKRTFNFSGEIYQFSVETYDRTYHIRAPSADVMHVWMACFSVPLKLITS